MINICVQAVKCQTYILPLLYIKNFHLYTKYFKYSPILRNIQHQLVTFLFLVSSFSKHIEKRAARRTFLGNSGTNREPAI